MPMYEYRCEACEAQFEVMQSMHARPEDTVCPHCQAGKCTRLMSMFASKVVGTHKPTFSEMKAYDMLNSRMDKFKKLPPITGKRGNIDFDFGGGGGRPALGGNKEGGGSSQQGAS